MKAKFSIKKTLSMIVVLVMLLTMIPAGMISASAAATFDLSGYDTATEYVITNAEDWAVIAAATDKDFAGKTVKLGADIDAAGAALATLFDSFAGTFDGQGHSVSNATVAGNALIADILVGGATVKNVKFVNIDVTGTDSAGLIAGKFSPKSEGETTKISKVNIDENSSVTATGKNAGGFFGVIPNVGNYKLVVEKVLVKVAVTGSVSGGLFGKEEGNRSHTSAFVNISNSVIAPSSAATSGIFGYFGGGKVNNPPIETSSMITLKNVAVDATNCTTALYGNCFNHSTTAEGVSVTKDQLFGTISGYANAFNTVHSARNNTITALAAIAENVPTLVSAGTISFLANYDADGFISGFLPADVAIAFGNVDVALKNLADVDAKNAEDLAAAIETLNAAIAEAEAAIAAAEEAATAADEALKAELAAAMAAANTEIAKAMEAIAEELDAVKAELEAANKAIEDLKAEDKALADANAAQDAAVEDAEAAAKAANTLALTGTIIGGVSLVLVIALAVLVLLRRKKA